LLILRIEEEFGKAAEETVADAGYWSGEQLTKANQSGFPVVVSMDEVKARRELVGPYNSSNFAYDIEKGCYICPRGEMLTYQKTRKEIGIRVYRCRSYGHLSGTLGVQQR
jgi:hypothetical protein